MTNPFLKMTAEEFNKQLQDNPSSKDLDIKKFIHDLEKEIETTEKDLEKEEELTRLQDMFKEYVGSDKLITSKEVVERLKNQPPEKKIMSGFPKLDTILSGFRPKQLIVVSAATKSGKTTFCVELTSKMADQNPTWLPFEESADELVQKFLDRGEQPPHFLTPARMTGNTLLWVEKKIIEAKAKFNAQVLFIDHLHFIVPFTAERQDLAIGQTMRELKRMAKQWDIIIFLIAHLKKTRMESQPDLEDLRDSSFIAQEADTVIMLWRKMETKNGQKVFHDEVNLSIQANRRTGKTGNLQLIYSNGHFTEKDGSHDETDSAREIANSENDAEIDWKD